MSALLPYRDAVSGLLVLEVVHLGERRLLMVPDDTVVPMNHVMAWLVSARYLAFTLWRIHVRVLAARLWSCEGFCHEMAHLADVRRKGAAAVLADVGRGYGWRTKWRHHPVETRARERAVRWAAMAGDQWLAGARVAVLPWNTLTQEG